jgi:glutamine synthetase
VIGVYGNSIGIPTIGGEIAFEEPYAGNGYEATGIGRIPWNLPDAIALWEGSSIAKESFGEDVHHHILTMAKGEWLAANQSVTDWELRRYWERI